MASLKRTTVVFPAGLKKRAMTLARKRKISFTEFVRQAVEQSAPAAAEAAEGEGSVF